MDEVDSSINGVNDPGGTISQLETLTCSHRLLPDEPKDQQDTCSLPACCLLTTTSCVPAAEPVLGVLVLNG